MAALAETRSAPGPGTRERVRKATPYLLLAPGILWLLVFFIVPSIQMFLTSVSSGSVADGFKLTFVQTR